MSVVEILTYLYAGEMRVDPERPGDPERDWLVMSKGHAGPALYATLAKRGFFPLDWLHSLNKGGTRLPSHCDRNKTPGVDMSTGSLGQGFSTACGIALGLKLRGKASRVYTIIGDGETDEGQIWEAALFAAHRKLDNMIAYTDYNKLQLDGPTGEILDLGALEEKWAAFGWFAQRVDGHDFEAIDGATRAAKARGGMPSMIVLDTVKGRGCSFAEGLATNHNMSFGMDEARAAIAALGD